MCGSKGSAPTPSGASTTTGGTSAGTSTTNFAQGPTGATGQRYEDFLNKVTNLADTPFDPAMQSTVAPLTSFQLSGLNNMNDLGAHLGDFDPARIREIESPFTQDVVDATQNWFNNTNKVQGNNLLGQGIKSGNAFGGDRQGIAEAELSGQQQLAQAPVIAGLYQSGYTQAVDEYNKLKQFGVQGAEEQVKAGTVVQAQLQREADVATANAQQRGAYPFQVANWQGAALGGLGPLTGTVGTGVTATQANSTGITNPPSPNPLSQALGIGSSLVGLGSAIFGKDGGRVTPRGFASGGYADDDSSYGSSFGGDDDRDKEQQQRNQQKDLGGDTNVQTSGTQDEILHDIEMVGKQKPVQPETPNIMGKFKVPRYKQPYVHIPNLGAGPQNVGQGTNPVASPLQSSSSNSTGSTIGGTLGTIGGSIIGGPVGGAIGGGIGRLFGGLFEDGGRVRYLELGGPPDEGDTGDTKDQGDPAARTPRTGDPESERMFRERMNAPPSRDTFGLDKLPTRPSIPTPDPLAPFLGTEGSRSVTGRPRGSPAGNPQQAREVSPLVLTRERIQSELEDNPRLARTFDANTTAEVGRGARARQGYQAGTIDRAVQTGQPLARVVNAPDYYPWSTRAARAISGQGVDDSLWAGANPINFGTGNASRDPRTGRDVAFAGGPQTASIGRERYGIEGQAGLPYARAVGYTGPDRTPIGFGPGAPVGSQGTPLEGGPPNAAGDLEVSAQKRRAPLPGDDPNAPNLGYGPATTHQFPGAPPRDFGQRWATNPFTQAGIAMLRSQSPHFAVGLGEGLAGAAGTIEHNREQQVLDSKPTWNYNFPTIMAQYGDGRMIDTHMPNPKYEANKLARDKFDYEQKIQKGQKWKPTGMVENGRVILYNEGTGQTKLGQRVGDDDKPIPSTAAPAPTTTTPDTAKTPATWAPNLNPAQGDPYVKELTPDRGAESKKTLEDRGKANIKAMDKAREVQETANQQIGRMNQIETALNALPKTGFMSPGYLAGYNATIASALNHAGRIVGYGETFSPNDVSNMEEVNKIKTLGGFLQTRLAGGGNHVAASMMAASMKAYPGAENSPQGAALIIAANREVSQRDRDYYEFLTKHGNTTFKGDLNAATLWFNRNAPMEKYIERARDTVAQKFGPNPAAAPTTQQPTTKQQTTGPQPMPSKPDVTQNGHTYRWNDATGKYQAVQ